MADRGTVVVTGAGSGIGRAAAIELAFRGYEIALVGRREGLLRETAGLCGRPCEVIALDIAAEGAATKVIERVRGREGFTHLAGLVNNAGWAPSGTIAESTEEIIRACFAINAVAPTALVAAAWPSLVAAGAHVGRATVVNVSSIATVDPFPNLYAYACSKMAMNMGARFVHQEGSPSGIRGFALLPGAVETPMLRGLLSETELPKAKTLEPRAIAVIIADCIDGRRDAESGSCIVIPSPE